MKAVTGFLTEDDTFFDKEQEAELYEAELELRMACEKPNIDDDRLIDALVKLQPQIQRYYDALGKHTSDERETGKDAAPALELTIGGDEPVPNVGRRSRAKRV